MNHRGTEVTEAIIGAAIEVHRHLGPGLLESVYEAALGYELKQRGIEFERQKQLNRAADDAFSAAAREHSSCPTKRDGGDLGEFPRMGMMVEPFAKAAFALKPYTVSDPVQTQYGYHLILVTGKKAGEAVAFEKVKGAVAEVYGARLREAVVEKMKAAADTKIEIAR